MRQFKNYEAVKINSEEESMEFLQYLEDNTDLRWFSGMKPTGISQGEFNLWEFPIFLEVVENVLQWALLESSLEAETKIIPLTEFIEPKATYTREQAEKMFKDYSLFHGFGNEEPLSPQVIAFLNHKFPKSTLEQVTEAVKDLGDFSIEQTTTGSIMISPIKITEQ